MITEQQKNKIASLVDAMTEAQDASNEADDNLNKCQKELDDYLTSLVEGETGENEFEIKAVRRKR